MFGLSLGQLGFSAVVVALVLGAIYVKGRSDGSASCQAAVAQAVVKQQQADKTLSDQLLASQKQALDSIHAQSLSAQQKVTNDPVTSGCGPAMRDSSFGVQSIIRGRP